MIWAPFALALVFGLVVSAGIYLVAFWPGVEPEEEPAGEPADDGPASARSREGS